MSRFVISKAIKAGTVRCRRLPILYIPARPASSIAMSEEKKQQLITAFEGLKNIPGQEQNLPGVDQKLEPEPSHTQLEAWDNDGNPYLLDYKGSQKLKGKKALITGGDSGIGRAAAQMFAREGADVTIVYLPQEEPDAQEVKKAIQADGQKCLALPYDLMEETACKEAIDKHMKEFGQLDVLVNNASKQIQCNDLSKIEMSNVESTFRSNVLGMFALTKYALPRMKRGSSIINTTSVTAFKGSSGMMDYSSTKGAIVTFTRSLAVQLASKGIRVNAVAPGPVHTPLQPASRPSEQMEDFTVGKVPLWGRAAMPAELGPTYVYLASADSNVMTGSIIHINSGQHMA